MASQAIQLAVQQAYLGNYGRPADPVGLEYWCARLEQDGSDYSQIWMEFFGSQEAQDLILKDPNGNPYSNHDLINNVYQFLFGRDADAAGLNFFASRLNANQSNLSLITLDILNGAQGNDKTIVQYKIDVSNFVTQTLATSQYANVPYTTGEIAAYRAVLATVGSSLTSREMGLILGAQTIIDTAYKHAMTVPAPSLPLSSQALQLHQYNTDVLAVGTPNFQFSTITVQDTGVTSVSSSSTKAILSKSGTLNAQLVAEANVSLTIDTSAYTQEHSVFGSLNGKNILKLGTSLINVSGGNQMDSWTITDSTSLNYVNLYNDNDVLTVTTGATLTVKSSLNLGGGNDTLKALGAIHGLIFGNEGADTLQLGSGNYTLGFNAGDTGDASLFGAGANSAARLDLVTGFNAGDQIQITGYVQKDGSSAGEWSNLIGPDNSLIPIDRSGPNVRYAVGNNEIKLVRGTYDTKGKTFTADNTGVDYLLVYDADSTEAMHQQAFVMTGLSYDPNLGVDSKGNIVFNPVGKMLTLAESTSGDISILGTLHATDTGTSSVTFDSAGKASRTISNVITEYPNVTLNSGDTITVNNLALSGESAQLHINAESYDQDFSLILDTNIAKNIGISITTGSGSNTMTLRSSVDQIQAGKGADSVALALEGSCTLIQRMGDSANYFFENSAINTSALDLISGFKASDKIVIGDYGSQAQWAGDSPRVVDSTISLGVNNNMLHAARGTYDANTKSFVLSQTGDSWLVVYDSDISASIQQEALVLLGAGNATLALGEDGSLMFA